MHTSRIVLVRVFCWCESFAGVSKIWMHQQTILSYGWLACCLSSRHVTASCAFTPLDCNSAWRCLPTAAAPSTASVPYGFFFPRAWPWGGSESEWMICSVRWTPQLALGWPKTCVRCEPVLTKLTQNYCRLQHYVLKNTSFGDEVGKCKSSFVSHSVVLNATMEQVFITGEDNLNNGRDQFLAWKKKWEWFLVRLRFPPFSESWISIATVLHYLTVSSTLLSLHSPPSPSSLSIPPLLPTLLALFSPQSFLLVVLYLLL